MNDDFTQDEGELLRSVPAPMPWTVDDLAIIAALLESQLTMMNEMRRRAGKTYKSEGPFRKVLAKIYTTYPELKP